MARTYSDLINQGYNLLFKYKTIGITNDENITGIESSLNDKYLDQMLELNKYIYTTASTNHPGEKFQPFFLDFIAPKQVCLKIIQYLSLVKYSYVIKELSIENGIIETNPLVIHIVENNDPKMPMLDARYFKRVYNNDRSHSKRDYTQLRELVSSVIYSEFPIELVEQYENVIKNDELCSMMIEDSDINDESLYIVLLHILYQIQ